MKNKTTKTKLILMIIVGSLLLIYSAWYLINFLKYQRELVLSVASQRMSCPKEQIEVGSSVGYNDSLTEIPVKGCNKEGLVHCYDNTRKHGMWGQYFAFDLECVMATNGK